MNYDPKQAQHCAWVMEGTIKCFSTLGREAMRALQDIADLSERRFFVSHALLYSTSGVIIDSCVLPEHRRTLPNEVLTHSSIRTRIAQDAEFDRYILQTSDNTRAGGMLYQVSITHSGKVPTLNVYLNATDAPITNPLPKHARHIAKATGKAVDRLKLLPYAPDCSYWDLVKATYPTFRQAGQYAQEIFSAGHGRNR